MKVRIPSALTEYTRDAREVEVAGRTLGEALDALEGRFPGIRFRIVSEQDRIRRHIKIFVNREQAAGLHAPVAIADEIMIVCALSGG